MATFTLSALQYSQDRKLPMKLYLLDANGFHRDGKWFMRIPQYPEEGEISVRDARRLAEDHMATGLEVRICDGGDMLVFHAKGGKMIYPPDVPCSVPHDSEGSASCEECRGTGVTRSGEEEFWNNLK